jgi:hypothetical protein
MNSFPIMKFVLHWVALCTFLSMCQKQVGWNLDGGNMLWQVDCPSPTYNENLIFPNPQKDLEEWLWMVRSKQTLAMKIEKPRSFGSPIIICTTLLYFLNPFVYLFTKIIIKKTLHDRYYILKGKCTNL